MLCAKQALLQPASRAQALRPEGPFFPSSPHSRTSSGVALPSAELWVPPRPPPSGPQNRFSHWATSLWIRREWRPLVFGERGNAAAGRGPGTLRALSNGGHATLWTPSRRATRWRPSTLLGTPQSQADGDDAHVSGTLASQLLFVAWLPELPSPGVAG